LLSSVIKSYGPVPLFTREGPGFLISRKSKATARAGLDLGQSVLTGEGAAFLDHRLKVGDPDADAAPNSNGWQPAFTDERVEAMGLIGHLLGSGLDRDEFGGLVWHFGWLVSRDLFAGCLLPIVKPRCFLAFIVTTRNNCYMSESETIKEKLEQKKSDILRQARGGSILAIANATGVSRQTLYRWQRGGMAISLRSVQERIANPGQGLNGEIPRGRKLRSTENKYFFGFRRKDRLTARKSLDRAILELGEALATFGASGAPMSGNTMMLLGTLFLSDPHMRGVMESLAMMKGHQFFPTNSDQLRPQKTTKNDKSVV
jgi:transcriptional regulator with XRE-family HTH domain